MNKLRMLRHQRHLTQKEVAKDLPVSLSYYGLLENNLIRPALPIAYALAQYFGCTIEDVFF
ncbi:hypothetical protein AN639_11285 [Candidatus Epulonipiscium fishelsonii]|nr:hypothetical protein AN639_11285 [Epulopiscium sp. SCG-B05WGA-EpuloA1]ONI47351.1 hypothetical protein AN644_00670 [Epulopiscium sp. SCG-C06WGA-EpuloA1]